MLSFLKLGAFRLSPLCLSGARFVQAVFLLAFFFPSFAYAATAPAAAYNGKVNNYLAQAVNYKATKQGFAANDPRPSQSMSALGAVASAVSSAASLMLTAGSPVRWINVVGKMFASAGAVLTVYQAGDLLYQVYANQDGTYSPAGAMGTTTATPEVSPSTSDLVSILDANLPMWFLQSGNKVDFYNQLTSLTSTCAYSGDDAAFQSCVVAALPVGFMLGNTHYSGYYLQTFVSVSPVFSSSYSEYYNVTGNYSWRRVLPFSISLYQTRCSTSTSCGIGGGYSSTTLNFAPLLRGMGASSSAAAFNFAVSNGCADGYVLKNGTCTGGVVTPTTLADATASVPNLGVTFNPVVMKNLYNTMVSQMDTTGGLSVGQLLMSDSDWADFNSSLGWQPTVADLEATVSAGLTTSSASIPDATTGTVTTSSGAVVSASPSVNSNSTPTASAAATEVNLGSDPNIGAPSLEAVPDAPTILAPILALFPSLKNYVAPAHTSTCPTATFSLWSETFTIDQHCAILESIKPTLQVASYAGYVVIALLIILSA